MFRINSNNIEISRGDAVTIELSIDGYTFKSGDVIHFNVYNANKLNETAILSKTVNVSSSATSVDISLSVSETAIGESINSPKEYWYQIDLNGNTTVLGYDEYGAKKFIVYPTGA